MRTYSKMKMLSEQRSVLITGGAGFIGSHLAERLVEQGFRVRILDDFSSGKRTNLSNIASQVEIVEGSVLNERLLRKAADGCRCIFHMAAVVSVPRSIQEPLFVHEVNATGTLMVLETAREHRCRVVLSSSAAVYGPTACPIQSEDEPLAPISPYGIQKLAGEMYLRSYHALHGTEGFALRYFNVYGPRQDPGSPYSGVISIFSKRVMQGEPITIYGDGSQTRDYVHVNDVVTANMAAMDAPNADGSGLNVGTGKAIDLNRLAREILDLAGADTHIAYSSPRPGDILHSCAHVELSRRRIGFQARVGVSEGLSALVGLRK